MCWMVPAALLAASPADGTGTLLVLPVESGALDPTERGVLEVLVTDEVVRRTTMTVITVAEIDELIDLQKKRQRLGCADEACIAQIAARARAQRVLPTRVDVVGTKLVLSVSLMDVERAEAIGSATR